MKKSEIFLLTLVCALGLSGCGDVREAQTSTYTFRGAHEYFSVSNGSIVLSDAEEVFDGGDLEITQAGVFDEVVSCTGTFYTLADGKRRTIMSNTVTDQTDGPVSVDGDLGKASGKGFVLGNKAENMDALRENLWFELKTTDFNGEEAVYQIQLILTE